MTDAKLNNFSSWLATAEAKVALLRDELESTKAELGRLAAAADARSRAREIVCDVLAATQGQVTGYIEDIVSLALATVYGPGYAFQIEHAVKRNQAEATPWIVIDGDRMSPREEVGGGVLDVAALAARLALWSLMTPRPPATFVLDEPGRFLSQDKQAAFGRMLRELSDLLGLQILLVSHSPGIIENADRAYEIAQAGGVSSVRKIH